ncbi:hypothetical protein ALP8811_01653 [Aliiroseovarius pelagivivens]|uniref:Uncharacterized protein n=1 Tax=Aliiroseovarius pelagivivens TaxID=1639690 RepID=A0A2R8AL74_9RHOB|nr:hypothetical protein ALP8811_01653 [Aliiroseovarius pelagivivens]
MIVDWNVFIHGLDHKDFTRSCSVGGAAFDRVPIIGFDDIAQNPYAVISIYFN